ncbi:MAG: fumarylacetoacetate hydrolase family protein [Clostridia bacterium]|nr:fumarylacetoacetate hydrolase family protein [Clostridia bacterium]
MVIARILTNNGIRYAEVKDDKYYLIEGDCFTIKSVEDTPYEGEYKVLAPVEPSKIIALGANYRKHAQELKLNVNADPTIFMKPSTSVIADGESIILPADATKVDYEAELAIIIGKDCRKVKQEDANSVIFGYTCANDVSERVFQKLDGQWTRAKGFDTFCPLGKYMVTDIDAAHLELKAVRNGEVVQQGITSDMIHDIPKTIAFISGIMTLKQGDVILTGTPEGVGQIKDGDTIEIVIEGIGSLKNPVEREK